MVQKCEALMHMSVSLKILTNQRNLTLIRAGLQTQSMARTRQNPFENLSVG